MPLVVLVNSSTVNPFELICSQLIVQPKMHLQWKFEPNRCILNEIWTSQKIAKNAFFLTIVPSEKFRYLENGTIFFQTACVQTHQTLAPIIYWAAYVKIRRGLCGMAHKKKCFEFKKTILRKWEFRVYSPLCLQIIAPGNFS